MKRDVGTEHIDVHYKKGGVWQKGVGSLRVKDGIYSGYWDVTGKSKFLHSVRTLDLSERVDVEPVDILMLKIEDAVDVGLEDWIQQFFGTIVIYFKDVYEFSIVDPTSSEEFVSELWFYGDPGSILIENLPVNLIRVPSSVLTLWCHEHTNIIGLENVLAKKNAEVEMGS